MKPPKPCFSVRQPLHPRSQIQKTPMLSCCPRQRLYFCMLTPPRSVSRCLLKPLLHSCAKQMMPCKELMTESGSMQSHAVRCQVMTLSVEGPSESVHPRPVNPCRSRPLIPMSLNVRYRWSLSVPWLSLLRPRPAQLMPSSPPVSQPSSAIALLMFVCPVTRCTAFWTCLESSWLL